MDLGGNKRQCKAYAYPGPSDTRRGRRAGLCHREVCKGKGAMARPVADANGLRTLNAGWAQRLAAPPGRARHGLRSLL